MEHGKKECYRSDYKRRGSAHLEAEGEKGDKGIPKGMPGSVGKGPKIDVPGEKGNKGVDMRKGFPKSSPSPIKND